MVRIWCPVVVVGLVSGVVIMAVDNTVSDLPHQLELGPDSSNDVWHPEFA
jgi:hypothetical protein